MMSNTHKSADPEHTTPYCTVSTEGPVREAQVALAEAGVDEPAVVHANLFNLDARFKTIGAEYQAKTDKAKANYVTTASRELARIAEKEINAVKAKEAGHRGNLIKAEEALRYAQEWLHAVHAEATDVAQVSFAEGKEEAQAELFAEALKIVQSSSKLHKVSFERLCELLKIISNYAEPHSSALAEAKVLELVALTNQPVTQLLSPHHDHQGGMHAQFSNSGAGGADNQGGVTAVATAVPTDGGGDGRPGGEAGGGAGGGAGDGDGDTIVLDTDEDTDDDTDDDIEAGGGCGGGCYGGGRGGGGAGGGTRKRKTDESWIDDDELEWPTMSAHVKHAKTALPGKRAPVPDEVQQYEVDDDDEEIIGEAIYQ
eukprot:SAG11_NODE_4490_length_1876_cov_3.339899_1_plen_370_part_00